MTALQYLAISYIIYEIFPARVCNPLRKNLLIDTIICLIWPLLLLVFFCKLLQLAIKGTTK